MSDESSEKAGITRSVLLGSLVAYQVSVAIFGVIDEGVVPVRMILQRINIA